MSWFIGCFTSAAAEERPLDLDRALLYGVSYAVAGLVIALLYHVFIYQV